MSIDYFDSKQFGRRARDAAAGQIQNQEITCLILTVFWT
jgi:hypothetical protein